MNDIISAHLPQYSMELDRAEEIRAAIIRTFSGRGVETLMDVAPTSQYCVGVISPKPPDIDEGRALRRAQRKPIAIGFAARIVTEDRRIEGKITLRFSLYYRALPNYNEEEQPELFPDNDRIRHRLRTKYHRVDIEIAELPFSVSTNPSEGIVGLDLNQANKMIGTKMSEVMVSISEDPRCWPSGEDFNIPRRALTSEASYSEAVRSKSGEPILPNWRLELQGDLRGTPDGGRLSLLVQNLTVAAAKDIHPSEIFDVGLELELEYGQFSSEPYVAASLDYRYKSVSWGQGINAVLEISNEKRRHAHTEALPIHYQARTRSRDEVGLCAPAKLKGEEAIPTLEHIATMLDSYADTWEHHNAELINDNDLNLRIADAASFRDEVARFRHGIAALQRDPRLLQAFRFANQAAERRQDFREWRLFQVVYIVSLLPSLLAREYPDDEILRRELDMVDVLWFPTGGGKTEAYFGIILVAMFYDRLRGKDRGATAWLRYPLRMLSIQQLQRLVEFVVVAEQVRAEKLPHNGADPFTVGYYVGSANTPNELTTFSVNGRHPIDRFADEAANNPDKDVPSLRVLQRCPYCQTPAPRIRVDNQPTEIRLHTMCSACGKKAPIYMSDSEIYRYAPTVLVGTVDRLARAGQTDLFSHIFARFTHRCPQHGYVSFDHCVEASCKVKSKEYIPVPDTYDPMPALLLQDELHLLKESLGTYDAHFEGFLDTLAAHLPHPSLPTKRLAATATIEGYENHVRQLYGRLARRFPVKGEGEFDSAYVALNTSSPIGRIYMGILPFGVDVELVASRIAQVVATEADRYRAEEGANQSVGDRYDLSLIYVNKKNTAGNLGASLSTMQSVRVLTGDRSLDDVRAAIELVEGDDKRPFEDRLKTLIATSIISHGVDLGRLNVMSFAGFPGRAADYIQSSSRVGRTNVGLVCTVFDPFSLLDRSTYLHFHEYHERLYQMVQPVPINRYSDASIERTFTGIYSAMVLNVVEQKLRQFASSKFPAKRLLSGKEFNAAVESGRVKDEEMIELIVESYGIEKMGLPSELVRKLRELIHHRVALARRNIEAGEGYTIHERLRPKPVSSLREVQEQIGFAAARRYDNEIETVRGYLDGIGISYPAQCRTGASPAYARSTNIH